MDRITHTQKIGHSPPGATFTPSTIDVAALRKSQGLSQSRFAARYSLPVSTIRDWEQGRRHPDRAAFLLLRLIEAEPEVVARTLANADVRPPASYASCSTGSPRQFGDESMEPRHHPDSHELHDWPMYGPKDPEIANLVDRLAYDHGLRVREIEEVILQALQNRLKAEEAGNPR